MSMNSLVLILIWRNRNRFRQELYTPWLQPCFQNFQFLASSNFYSIFIIVRNQLFVRSVDHSVGLVQSGLVQSGLVRFGRSVGLLVIWSVRPDLNQTKWPTTRPTNRPTDEPTDPTDPPTNPSGQSAPDQTKLDRT